MTIYVNLNDKVQFDYYNPDNIFLRIWRNNSFWRPGDTIDPLTTMIFIGFVYLFLWACFPLIKRLYKIIKDKTYPIRCYIKYKINKIKSIEYFSIKMTILCKHYNIEHKRTANTYDNVIDADFEELKEDTRNEY